MAEIKFRWVGKNKHFNTITIVDDLTLNKLLDGRYPTFFSSSNREEHNNCKFLAENLFTGLKDKNGKELYFEDFVLLQDDIPFSKEPYRVVQDDFGVPCFVHNERFGVMTSFETYFLGNPNRKKSDFEIVGNVFQNPELLEGK